MTTKAVKKIVDSKDNIIDQLEELNKHYYMKGVRRFIDRLIVSNMNSNEDESKYILYCVAKHYYHLDVVKEVKLNYTTSLPFYGLSDTYNYEFVQNLVTSKESIIDQCKLLREHRDSKDVQEYINLLQKENDDYYEQEEYNYVIYCINKYYYGRKVPKMEQPQPTIRLYAYVKEKPFIMEPVDNFTPLEDIEKGEKVKILNGPFRGLIGLVREVDLDNDVFNVSIDIFGEDTMVELDTQQNKVIKIDDDNES